MRIACLRCNAAYDVPPERVPPGRAVRCARCGESWTPVPAPAAVVEDPDPEPEPEPEAEAVMPPLAEPAPVPVEQEPVQAYPAPNVIERTGISMMSGGIPDARVAEDAPVSFPAPGSADGRKREPGRAGAALLAMAWLATVLLLVGLGWAVVVRRADIMQTWPPSQRAYATLGLAAPEHGHAAP